MKTIIVASKNPVKLNAALLGFQRMFPGEEFAVDGVSVVSGVSDQPLTDAETLRGAMNRAEAASKEAPNADYWVGLEGGIEERDGDMEVFAWIVVKDRAGMVGRGRTATFFLPEAVAELIRAGKELGEADDIVFKRTNSKQTDGACGLLTAGVIDRMTMYLNAVIFAIIPLKNPELYEL